MNKTHVKELLKGAESWNRYVAKMCKKNPSWVVDLSDADLSRADLSDADLSDADLSRADLSGAKLYGAKLSCADLSRADLSRADLSGAKLYGAKLSCANIDYSAWPLWCGGIGAKIDIRIARQLVYHAFAQDCDDKEYKRLRKLVSKFANEFHCVKSNDCEMLK